MLAAGVTAGVLAAAQPAWFTGGGFAPSFGSPLGWNGIPTTPPAPTPDDPNAWMLIGQSNMTGRDFASNVTNDAATYIRNVQASLQTYRVLTLIGDDVAAERDWDGASPRNTGRFGPSLSFVHDYALAHQAAVLYFTKNGSSLAQDWCVPGGLNEQSIAFFQQQLARFPGPFNLGGFFSGQGNADAIDEDDADAYFDNFTEMVLAFRAAFGMLPWIFWLIPTWLTSPYVGVVRAAQLAVAASQPGMYYYDVDDLYPSLVLPDGLHFNGNGSVIAGQRGAAIGVSLL